MKKRRFTPSRWTPYFLSIIVVIFLFFSTGFLTGHFVNNFLHNQILNESLNLTEGTNFSLQTMIDATQIIEDLMHEKLITASKVLVSYEDDIDNESLKEIASGADIDEIYIYNNEGTIVFTNDKYLGYQAPSDHPVSQFMKGEEGIAFDEIRKDTEGEGYYKYAYFRLNDNYMVQTGLKAERIKALTERFSTQNYLDEVLAFDSIIRVELMLDESKISSLIEFQKSEFEMDDFESQNFLNDDFVYREVKLEHTDVLEVISPLIVEDEVVGSIYLFYTLAPTQRIIQLVQFFIGLLFALLAIILGILVWTLYIKNENIDTLSYSDSELDVYNRAYFFSNLRGIMASKTVLDGVFVIFVFENLGRLRLIHSYDKLQAFLMNLGNNFKVLWNENLYRYVEDTIVFYVSDIDDIAQLIHKIERTKMALLDSDKNYLGVNILTAVLPINQNYQTEENIAQNIELAILDLKKNPEQETVVFNESLWEQVLFHEQLEIDLRHLSRRGFDEEMFVAYQPLVDANTKEIVGFETLSRWLHPVYGLVSPEVYFKIAERSDLIYSLSDWVMHQSALFAKDLLENYEEPYVVSVNISVAQLKDSAFIKCYKNIIKYHGITPQSLGIEITETVLAENTETINKTLKTLRDMGTHISLDDFGTGYASLSTLQSLEVDVLKIDKSFVDTMFEDGVMIQGITDIAQKMKLKTVAEGVETEAQLEALQALKINTIQGFYFSKPVSKEHAKKLLEKHRGNNT